MVDEPQIVTSEAWQTAVIRLDIPRADIQKVMGPAMGEVMAAVAAQGLKPAGPLFAHYFSMPPGRYDFEVGVPVATPVQPAGRVVPGTLAGRRVARTIYHGGYEGLHTAWSDFGKWLEAHGHAVAPDLWEVYVAGPESGPDPSSWRTELNRPLQP
jgi:effector-binding domain-containing protein